MCEVDRNSVRKNAWQHAKLKEGVGAEANFAESYSTKSCEHTLEEFFGGFTVRQVQCGRKVLTMRLSMSERKKGLESGD